MTTSKRWTFTINNYTEADEDRIKQWNSKYVVYGKEVGESLTPHLQGYVIWEKTQRLSGCKKAHPTAHWEIAKGTTSQNYTYCTKDNIVTEIGNRPSDDGGKGGGDAEKARWEAAKTAAIEGRVDDVPADIYVRYYRTLQQIAKDHMSKAPDASHEAGIWLYGLPRTGKSRVVREVFPEAYDKPQNKWWDGYRGESVIHIEDFDCKEMGHLMKIWLDRYGFTAETKGSAMHIRPKTVIVTSNYLPEDLWGNDLVMAEAIRQRCKFYHIPYDLDKFRCDFVTGGPR